MANYTILLIDYEPRSIERTRRPLLAAGYTVHVATDGLSGIAAFSELQPDLVLIEAMIPKKHGFEVCQDLKKTPQGKRTPFVIMTSVYKGRKYRSQALHLYQCDEYVEKPVPEDQLLAVVRRFIGEAPAPAPGTRMSAPTPSVRPEQTDMEFVGNLSDDDSGIEIEIIDEDTDAAAPEPARPASTPPGPRKVVMSSDEAEIMERLDAIIPGPGSPHSSPQASFGVAAVAARQLHDPVPSEVVIASADEAIVSEHGPAPADTSEGSSLPQVVSFERAKRSRKGKRGRGARTAPADPSPQPTPQSPPPHAWTTRDPAEPADARDAGEIGAGRSVHADDAQGDAPEERPTFVGDLPPWGQETRSSLPYEAARVGVPRWVWVVAAVGAALVIYWVVLR